MDWENERYVKLYTRDAADWLALSFDAQSLLMHLFRKVDRLGFLDLGRHGKRAVAIAVGQVALWDRLAPALEELLADGCVVVDGNRLLVRNFVEAQEARKSNAQRQRDFKAMRRAKSNGSTAAGNETLAGGNDPKRAVTTGNSPEQNRTETHPQTPSLAEGGGSGGSVEPARTDPVVHCPAVEHALNPDPMDFRDAVGRAAGIYDLATAAPDEDRQLLALLRSLWGQGLGPDRWPVAGAFLAAGGLRGKKVAACDAGWLVRSRGSNLRWLLTTADAWDRAGRPALDAAGRFATTPAKAAGPPRASPHVTGAVERIKRQIAEAQAARAAAAGNVVPLRPTGTGGES